jgi:hypothetical protein
LSGNSSWKSLKLERILVMSNLREAAQQALEWAKANSEAVFAGGGMAAVDGMNAWSKAFRAALAEPEPYDQQALELCEVCGWKTLIPTEGCLNCERQPKAELKPVAWYGVSPMFGTVTFDSYQDALDAGFDNPLPLIEAAADEALRAALADAYENEAWDAYDKAMAEPQEQPRFEKDKALLLQAREAINLLMEDLDVCDCAEEARWCPRVRGEAALHLLNERLK